MLRQSRLLFRMYTEDTGEAEYKVFLFISLNPKRICIFRVYSNLVE